MNLSIAHGIVPDQMKIARVVPLFKADDQSLFTNYRPVLVLPSFSKFLEGIIYNRLYDYLTNLHILCDNQFGFRKNHSTTLALIDLHEKIFRDQPLARDLHWNGHVNEITTKANKTLNFSTPQSPHLFGQIQRTSIQSPCETDC